MHPEISRFKQKWVRLRRQLGEMRAGDFAAAPFRLTSKASSCRCLGSAAAIREVNERAEDGRPAVASRPDSAHLRTFLHGQESVARP